MWEVEDGGERFWVAAHSAEDALCVLVECQMADYPDVETYRREQKPVVKPVAGHSMLAITDEDKGVMRMQAAEWVKHEGRGYLGGTVW